MDFENILRRLVVCEIALFGLVITALFIDAPRLPAELQRYLEAPAADDWIAAHPAYWVGLSALMILGIVSWVALWRGWRSGRRLYTATWICSLPTYVIGTPHITGALTSIAELLSTLTAGLIFGLLYFTEIRARFETPRSGGSVE